MNEIHTKNAPANAATCLCCDLLMLRPVILLLLQHFAQAAPDLQLHAMPAAQIASGKARLLHRGVEDIRAIGGNPVMQLDRQAADLHGKDSRVDT